jgi:FHS family L-fucose permease-like MFS transporter
VMGRISDASSIQIAFVVPLLCHAYILFFGLRGYKPAVLATVNPALAAAHGEVE